MTPKASATATQTLIPQGYRRTPVFCDPVRQGDIYLKPNMEAVRDAARRVNLKVEDLMESAQQHLVNCGTNCIKVNSTPAAIAVLFGLRKESL